MSQAVYLAPFVRSFFEDHLVCRHNASQHTIQCYRDGLKLLLRFVAEQAKKAAVNLLVTDITEPLVLAFLADLEQTRGNAIQTRNHRLVGIRQLFEYIAAGNRCSSIIATGSRRSRRNAARPYLKSTIWKRNTSLPFFVLSTRTPPWVAETMHCCCICTTRGLGSKR